jgi:hypothetical protein
MFLYKYRKQAIIEALAKLLNTLSFEGEGAMNSET